MAITHSRHQQLQANSDDANTRASPVRRGRRRNSPPPPSSEQNVPNLIWPYSC
ncbi:uncharacterized protein G2W53_022569 [Senna tora]|uniref:Uncharacterized protein n=1 Tax=Senna tora TaxID=362788 RepID=A0A834TPW7_9FABA|nr:uncharacterized protein G2W53_022569 [Senna tora]